MIINRIFQWVDKLYHTTRAETIRIIMVDVSEETNSTKYPSSGGIAYAPPHFLCIKRFLIYITIFSSTNQNDMIISSIFTGL